MKSSSKQEKEGELMCTEAEGRQLDRTLLKYYRGRKVDEENRPVLDKLARAAYVEYYFDGDSRYARASRAARDLRPKFIPYMRMLLGRV